MQNDEHAPVLGTWRAWYVLVIVALAILIALMAVVSAQLS